MSMDISDFYQTFFDEADELLADMEQHLLELDPLAPDIEPLNAIFRAAHSIKGGAATFGFSVLQETTHLLENLLDGARRQEMSLSTEIINLFLETKDIMQEQLDAYKTSQQPDAESFEYICQALRQLALEAQQQQEAPAVQPAVQQPVVQHAAAPAAIEGGMRISLNGLKASEIPLMLEELGNLGEVKDPHQTEHSLDVTLLTSASEDDISAVLCFVLEPEQISFSTPTQSEPAAVEASLPEAVAVPEPAPAPVARLDLRAAPVEWSGGALYGGRLLHGSRFRRRVWFVGGRGIALAGERHQRKHLGQRAHFRQRAFPQMAGHFAANGAQGVGDARHQGAFGAILLRQFILQPRAAAGKVGALLFAAVEQGTGIAQRDFSGGAFQQRRGAYAGGQRRFVAKVGQRVDAKQRIGFSIELQRRLQGVPVTGHRLVDQRQPVGVARQPAQLGPGAGEIQHDAQVFGAR